MELQLDEQYTTATGRAQPLMRLHHELPDIYEPRRRRLPPMVVAGFGFMLAATAFYGAQAYLPAGKRPSDFMGGFETQMAKARAEGELSAKIKFEEKLKVVETAAIGLQETCRATLARSNEHFKYALERANAAFQMYAQEHNTNAQIRNQVAANTTAADQQAATLAGMFGYGGLVLGNREFAEKSFKFAEDARRRAYETVEDAMRRNAPVSVADLQMSLPDPSSLPTLASCDLPTLRQLPSES
jgi:hypothetical protein